MKSLQQAGALIALAGSLCIGASAFGSDAKTSTQSPDTTPSNGTLNAARIVVDPETGEIRAPNAEELRALIAAQEAARQAAGVARAAAPQARVLDVLPAQKSVVRHPNGMVSVKLSMDSLSALTVHADANGKSRLAHEGTTAVSTPAEEK
jgi:hypothetical protein